MTAVRCWYNSTPHSNDMCARTSFRSCRRRWVVCVATKDEMSDSVYRCVDTRLRVHQYAVSFCLVTLVITDCLSHDRLPPLTVFCGRRWRSALVPVRRRRHCYMRPAHPATMHPRVRRQPSITTCRKLCPLLRGRGLLGGLGDCCGRSWCWLWMRRGEKGQ